jgi:aspartyl protease family protein
MRNPAAMIAIVLFAMLAVLLAARVFAPQTFATGDDQVRLVYLVGWLALLGAGLFMAGRIRIGHALRSLLVWSGIFLFLIAIYALRDDFGDLYAKMRGEIVPAAPMAVAEARTGDGQPRSSGGAASVRRSQDGHFWAEAQVNGARVRFLVDTGASTVALTQTDARRVGLDVDSLRYGVQVMTAGGVTYGAPVRLRQVSVGGVRLDDVEALVMQNDDLQQSLLGMSFLGRLSRYEATQDALILRR